MAHLYPYNSGAPVTLRSGRTVYVEKHDRIAPPDPSTPDIPIVFVHGFQYTIKTWVPLLPHLPDYTRIVFDCEPYGRTGWTGGRINTATHVRDIDDILFHFGYTPESGQVIVVGHSGGTLTAIQFAHDFPKRTKKIVLLGPLRQPTPQVLKDMAASGRVKTLPWEQFLAHHQSWLGPQKRHDTEILALIESEMRAHEERPGREASQAYFQGLADFEFKGAGGVEAWVVKGTHDTALLPGAVEAVRELLGARMLEVDTGHFFGWEDLEGTLKTLRTALGSDASLRDSEA